MLISNLHLSIIKHFFFDVNSENVKIGTPLKDKIITEKNIEFFTNLTQISGPVVYFDNRIIRLDERFLSVLWAITYYHLVMNESIYDEDLFDSSTSCLNLDMPILAKATSLLDWAFRQLECFENWDITLPNPTHYSIVDPREDAYITQANYIYCKAVSFLLFHEYGHLILLHENFYNEFQSMNFRQMSKEEIIQAQYLHKEHEKEADNYAFSMLLSDSKNENSNMNNFMGVCMATLILLFYSKDGIIDRKLHPDVDQRILNAMNYYAIEDSKMDNILQSMNIGIARFFANLQIDLLNGLDNHIDRETFFRNIMEKFDQIKNR
ncbi:phage exclusion protein Lit family protein [Leptospira sp. 85282-16]|uniref:phage exclusion protein Lit family protein n=1 Tax=Leptospira TaxID=171 RepID=UPI0010847A45|nr:MULTISPECIES: phage exclusion protein Lit family protein [Leptospira]MCT8335835.1 phage exclusion protein Lit family protein [Leptospira sp. 85282-16]TGK82713.1 hypothetical protein EHQ19_08320 [Leptospira montravelensis]